MIVGRIGIRRLSRLGELNTEKFSLSKKEAFSYYRYQHFYKLAFILVIVLFIEMICFVHNVVSAFVKYVLDQFSLDHMGREVILELQWEKQLCLD